MEELADQKKGQNLIPKTLNIMIYLKKIMMVSALKHTEKLLIKP